MDQEGTMDFRALRAKFQDEELLQKQPKIKPVLPDKPRVVPPQSPTYYLPAGARPSLLTSMNESLEGKTLIAPRVVFKDEKKESKIPLIQTNSKGKDKSEGKLKGGKGKTRKEQLDDKSSDQKQKKENGKDKRFTLVLPGAQKQKSGELVPVTAPPKATTPKKKGFPDFKRLSKRNSVEITADSILDTPSSDISGPAPLIPVPSGFDDVPPQLEISTPKAFLTNMSDLPDSSAPVEMTSPPIIPAFPDFSPPPSFIPDIPVSKIATPENERTETPVLLISRPASQNEIMPSTRSVVSTLPPSRTSPSPLPVLSTPSPSPPEPQIPAEAGIEAVKIAAVAAPPPPVINPQPISTSPKAERPISALSALERAEDKSPGKRSNLGDHRILSALEKARRKTTSTLTNPTTSYSVTPLPEELPPPQSPTCSLPELPPIDYEDRTGNAFPLKSAQVNGLDHRQASPVYEGTNGEGSDAIPEVLVVPPPSPLKGLPDPSSMEPTPEKHTRPRSFNLSEIIPPPPHELPVSPEIPETDTKDVREFKDVALNAYCPELPGSELGNGEYTGQDISDGLNDPKCYGNGITAPGVEVHAVSVYGEEYQEDAPLAGSETEIGNDVYESTENVYEDVSSSATKKKGKSDSGKKRKGPPKNPYAEAAQETKEEKTKTGRFGKSDKKAVAEGADEKDLKKKEKQRLEKEKKELKEKQERERKEQKEREKKENEIKKKFKITGQEDALYQATVTATKKGRKNDLPLKNGDVVSVIRTTDCPKGKWLARDSSNNYGYVAVNHMELDIQEMLELGKKTAVTRKTNRNVVDGEATSTGSRFSNHYRLSQSFSDDSEEWAADDDEPLSPALDSTDALAPMGHSRTFSMPDMGNKDLSINHQHSHSDINASNSRIQARHEAIQKLATFFHSPKPAEPAASAAMESPVLVKDQEAVHLPEDKSTQETDFDRHVPILPPPDFFA